MKAPFPQSDSVPRALPGRLSLIGSHAAVLTVAVCSVVALFDARLMAGEPRVPDFNADVAPIFRKYCTGCHNAEDKEGELVLERFSSLMKGGAEGPVVVPGQVEKSRLIQVLEKTAEPFMPPEDNEGPSEQEIALLKAWIRAGGRGPSVDRPETPVLVTPTIEPVGEVRAPINAVAYSPDGEWIAQARYRAIDLLAGHSREHRHTLEGLAGNVNDVGFSADGKILWAAGGEAGLAGEATLWSTDDWRQVLKIDGHRDSLYAAALSRHGRLLATGSYDQKIKLWDTTSGSELREMTGHNGPVFDLAFHPGGRILASASGDRTVKLWDVETGERLETFNEPTQAQYAVAFSPDGRYVVAAGVDKRIRVWEIQKDGTEGTNPIVFSRFAHEAPTIRLAFAPDGHILASSAEDRTVKFWEAETFTQLGLLSDQPDWASALAIAPDNATLLVGRLDGTTNVYQLPAVDGASADRPQPLRDLSAPEPHADSADGDSSEVPETEPNDHPEQAQELTAPVTVAGTLLPGGNERVDADVYRFEAKAGQTWMIETNAARNKSPADTKIEVLHADGQPVLRCRLRAVRDSYITFRPINSRQDGVRVENWEEMDLNEYMYLSGEICKLFRAPQGPDSAWVFYTNGGKRRCYFDSSATTHAKDEPVYIVEAYPPGTELADNGLPVFPHYFANDDDDGQRKLGTDSRLAFTAPADAAYLVRVTDVRGFGGSEFKYSLTIREPKPDFNVTIEGKDMLLPAGGGKRMTFKLDCVDNFHGEVRIDVSDVPDGYSVSSPIVVQPGHVEAYGVINSAPHAKPLNKEDWSNVKVTASARIHGEQVVKDVGDLGWIKLDEKPKAVVTLLPDVSTGANGKSPSANELVIRPGTTISALLRIQRNDFDGELRFDVDNLPHGVIVDNLGLSGIMIREKELERQIFISAADWVPETTRWVFATARSEENPASRPLLLHVRRADESLGLRSPDRSTGR